MTFEEQFPSLKGKRKDILGDRTGQEWSGFYIDEDDVKAHCLDKQRSREIIDELTIDVGGPNTPIDAIIIRADELKKRLSL